MPKRHRRGGVKQQHSIIPGIRRKLQKIAACPHVQAVTPGRISPAVGSQQPVIVFQYFQETGMKLVGKIPGAVQEIFVVTSAKEAALNWLTAAQLVLLEENRPGKAHSRGRKARLVVDNSPPIVEASPDTIREYMASSSTNSTPMAIPIGDRLNGQMHHLQDQLTKQAENKKRQAKATKKRRSQLPYNESPQPTTMEAWLDAADKRGVDYWQKIKSDKDPTS